MQDRRFVLKSGMLVLLGGLAGWPVPVPARPVQPGFHLVNGWILTDRDLVALGLDDDR
jgi:hypothetical protein